MRTGLLALLLSGCAVTEPISLSWSVDTSCETPSDVDRAAMDEAIVLWADGFDTYITHDAASAQAVLVCFSDDPVLTRSGNSVNGLTSRTDNGYRIAIDRRSMRFAGRFYAALVAHEFGHVVLTGSSEDHLAPGEVGIMAPDHNCGGDDPKCTWSDADIELVTHLLSR